MSARDLKSEMAQLRTVTSMNAQVALVPKGFAIIKQNQSVKHPELAEHLLANDYHSFVDVEDPENRGFQVLALYFESTDLAQLVLGSNRHFYFEMDLNLANKFI